MKRAKQTLAVLLAALMIMLCLTAAFATGGTEGSITWNYDVSSRTLTFSGSGAIPDHLSPDDRPWKDACGSGGCKTVVIQNGITGIGRNAFIYCSALESVSIPSSVKSIGITAFQNCSKMTFADLGSGVTSIGAFAFEACYELATVTMGNNVKVIDQYAFANCQKLSALTLSTSVSSVGERAFENCYSLTALTFPNSLKTIGEKAFLKNNGLQTVTIPDSVTSIGAAAFADCAALQTVNYGGTEPQWNGVPKGDYVFGLSKSGGYAERTASEALTFNFDMGNVTLTLFTSTLKKRVTNTGGTVKGSGTFGKGTQTVITAIPDVGFAFDGWYGVHPVDGTLTVKKYGSAAQNVSVNGNETLCALFVKAPDYTVTANAAEGGTATGGGTFPANKTVVLTAAPNSGWRFVGWYEGSAKLSDSASYSYTVTKNTTLTARFEKVEPTIEPKPVHTHSDENNDGKCDECKQQMTGGDHCPQCGKIHKGFFQKIVGFFHKIIYRLTHLFKKKN